MICSFKHEDLKSALMHLRQAVLARPTLPILTNALLQVNKTEATLTTSDLSMTIVCKLPCESKDEFAALVPFNEIKTIIDLVYGDVKIELKKKATIVSCNQDVFNLGSQESKAEDFPTVPTVPVKNKIEVTGAFQDSLNRALLTVSKDDLRPAMKCICMDIKKTEMWLASTDASQLFTKKMAIESEIEDQVLISSNIAKAIEGFNNTTISFNKQNVAFCNEHVTVIGTRTDERFPNYQNIIPKEYELNLDMISDSLKVALGKACIANANGSETKFVLKPTEIIVNSSDTDTGRDVNTTVDCDYKGSAEYISLSAERMKTCLAQLRGFDRVHLSIESPQRACLISPEGDADMVLLLMPMFKA